MNKTSVLASFLAATLSFTSCSGAPKENKVACQNFQSLMQDAANNHEDLILVGLKYVSRLNSEVIAHSDFALANNFIHLREVMELKLEEAKIRELPNLQIDINQIYKTCKLLNFEF